MNNILKEQTSHVGKCQLLSLTLMGLVIGAVRLSEAFGSCEVVLPYVLSIY